MFISIQNDGFISFLMKNIMLTILTWVLISGLAFLDAFIKCTENKDSKENYNDIKGFFKVCVQKKPIILLCCMILPFTLWSILVSFCNSKHFRKNINYIEVLPFINSSTIDRAQSKRNLHTIVQEIEKDMYYTLFD